MQIKEIITHEEISETFAVLRQIYENLSSENYTENVAQMMKKGYKMAAVFEDPHIENGRCIGVVGVRKVEKLHYGKAIEIEDFMIDRQKRGIGVGKMLLRFVDWQAMASGCKNIVGTLETKRIESQKIFSREKFILDGFLFRKTV